MVNFKTFFTEVTKKDIMSGLSNIAQGYVDANGNLYTRNSKGQLFRKGRYGGTIYINDKGQYHREDGPAVVGDNYEEWYLNGKRHREDGPAIVYPEGTKMWYFNNRLHRLDGPAVEYPGGNKVWYVNGKRHRLDGPAFIGSKGLKKWYVNGKRHRLDGPAIEYPGGSKNYFINGVKYTEPQWREKVKELQLK